MNSNPRRTASMTRRSWARFEAAVRAWWREQTTDEMALCLAEARDETAFAYRVRRWNELDRQGRPPLL